MPPKIKVLIVDDQPAVCAALQLLFELHGLPSIVVNRPDEALDLLLGTQGWRRFAEQQPAVFAQREPGQAQRLLLAKQLLTESRLPITAVQTIDVPQMFNQRRINAAVVRTMLARFPAIFEREASFAISQAAART